MEGGQLYELGQCITQAQCGETLIHVVRYVCDV